MVRAAPRFSLYHPSLSDEKKDKKSDFYSNDSSKDDLGNEFKIRKTFGDALTSRKAQLR